MFENQTITTTSADGKTVSISRDLDGGGIIEQTETRQTKADGSTVDTLTNVNADGSMINQAVTSVSGDGLTKTVQTDSTGDGVFDLTTVDTTVVNADGSRTETVTNECRWLLARPSVTATSASAQAKTLRTDSTGDGVFDLTQVSQTLDNADGSTTTTVTEANADGSLRDRTVTTLSANGLAKTTETDFDREWRVRHGVERCHGGEWRWQPHRDRHRPERQRQPPRPDGDGIGAEGARAMCRPTRPARPDRPHRNHRRRFGGIERRHRIGFHLERLLKDEPVTTTSPERKHECEPEPWRGGRICFDASGFEQGVVQLDADRHLAALLGEASLQRRRPVELRPDL